MTKATLILGLTYSEYSRQASGNFGGWEYLILRTFCHIGIIQPCCDDEKKQLFTFGYLQT
ncbi:hypothetical protein B6N60_01474 [Richelia sinica FACHB-800]|uniref:Uncharacterized protein n=1 Tax=Richelia sinica FACHB-800 TaxID=1357546 RepID=A0A975T5X3_9NOST|nr:hypothetical protein B6N60_01474 [Richelia sinica FACHB-800]